ncbi:MAG: GAF domain-containing protein [Acidobacteriota bacterium]|nr:MAG: GAF domain-containing protein [Acidobacteriota bacterium]
MPTRDTFSELKSIRVIRHFAEALTQANSVEDVLWLVAKEGIAPMGLEDCVVYLVDPASSTLVQRAAHGPKNPQHREIFNPILIPMGKGIVGTVAATGKPELILDTRSDRRYILDDEMRLSELAVPITVDGRVVGVIDSEHPDPAFYEPLHLETIQTLATLASSKMGSCLKELRNLTEQLSGRTQEDGSLLIRPGSSSLAEMKSRFIGQLHHEIRTPLNGILGMSEVLLLEDHLEQAHKEMVEAIQQSGMTLLETMTSLLEYSEISTTGWQAKYGPINLHELLTTQLQKWKSDGTLQNSSLTLELDPRIPPDLWSDESGICQVLTLLLKKLVRSRPGAPLIVTTRIRTETLDECSIDYQIGFNEPGTRLIGAGQEGAERFDLSLAVAGRIIHALKGKISLPDPARGDQGIQFVLPMYRFVETSSDD